jgi:hypothetical protein
LTARPGLYANPVFGMMLNSSAWCGIRGLRWC